MFPKFFALKFIDTTYKYRSNLTVPKSSWAEPESEPVTISFIFAFYSKVHAEEII